jgi:selenocysteine lyase/cysteine desulfurase
LQVIKTALAIQLKEKMGVKNILEREHEIIEYVFSELDSIQNIYILANQHQDRLGVISFYIDDLHFNLGVKLLNDKFGIQTRGGCSCAGTYGHYLLHVDQEKSHDLVCQITSGDLIKKPGWIRMSIHPTTTSEEIKLVCDSIKALAQHHQEWSKEYQYEASTNEFAHKNSRNQEIVMVKNWFEL